MRIAKQGLILHLSADFISPTNHIACTAGAHGKQLVVQHRKLHLQHCVDDHTICVDLVGLFHLMSINGNKYALRTLNNATWYLLCVPIASKATIQHALFVLVSDMNRSFPLRMNTVYADRGGKFNSRSLLHFVSSNDIAITHAPTYHPESTGITGRVNFPIIDSTRCNLAHARLSETYWRHSLIDSVSKYSLLCHAFTGEPSYVFWYFVYFTYTTFTIWRPWAC